MLKKLNNMKVQPRLVLCFLIVVMMASISGILGTVLLITTDSNYSKALVQNGFSQGEIGTFNTYLNKGAAVVRDIIMLTDAADIKESQDELSTIQDKTSEALAALKLNCTTDKELEYIAVIDKKLPEYRQLREQVVALGLQNKNEEALEMFRDVAQPVLNEIMAAAEGLADHNVDLGEKASSYLTKSSTIAIIVIIAIIIITLIISVIFAVAIAKAFSGPIIQVRDASYQLAQGDLDIDIDVDSKDEIGEMADSFKEAMDMMKRYIAEISRELGEIAKGNFDTSCNVKFKGNFIQIGESMEGILKSLNDAMHQINDASGQVAMGAEQMSESAQSLAEGCTEQAGAVEELTATIENVTALVVKSSENAEESYTQAQTFEKEAENCSISMGQLIQAMERISATSQQIENIIADIEDIASQTNLLSLNASIEAARAGEAGKGFAVVADQIGKLASDSANSAVNTRKLIGSSIEEITEGNHITTRTSESIEKVIEGIKLLAESSREISGMSKTQAETMRQIEQGIEQISGVVQNNSATAQETSATSEELSAQSENLKALVDQFKLKD